MINQFAIIADETRDISGLEQLVLSFRWVDQSYEIYEDFIGMVSIECTNASSLKSVILDCLIRCNLPVSGCCGQPYDEAAVMAGHLTGVALQIRRMEPKAISIYCLAHSLNLCLQDCATQLIQTSLSILSEMEDILISASNETLKQPSEKIVEIYSSVINFDKLVNWLSMRQDFVQVKYSKPRDKKITKVTTICKVMSCSDLGKSMFT